MKSLLSMLFFLLLQFTLPIACKKSRFLMNHYVSFSFYETEVGQDLSDMKGRTAFDPKLHNYVYNQSVLSCLKLRIWKQSAVSDERFSKCPCKIHQFEIYTLDGRFDGCYYPVSVLKHNSSDKAGFPYEIFDVYEEDTYETLRPVKLPYTPKTIPDVLKGLFVDESIILIRERSRADAKIKQHLTLEYEEEATYLRETNPHCTTLFTEDFTQAKCVTEHEFLKGAFIAFVLVVLFVTAFCLLRSWRRKKAASRVSTYHNRKVSFKNRKTRSEAEASLI